MARWTIKQVAQLGTKKAKDMNQAEFRAAMQAKHAGAGRAKPSKPRRKQPATGLCALVPVSIQATRLAVVCDP